MDEKDLEKLSLPELRELRGQIDRAITGFTDRKRREALAAAEEAVKQHGFSLADLTRRGGKGRSAGSRSSAAAAPGRYANPSDASQTWSGRGRRPAWLVEGINSGKSLEDFAI